MFAVDMPSLFSDFAVDARWGESEIVQVILDIPDELMLGNNLLAANNQLIFPADKFSGIDEGGVVEIIGADMWVLRETPRISSDGGVKTVSVQKYEEPV